MLKKILVTGAGGFLGTKILEQNRSNSMRIIAATSHPSRIQYDAVTAYDRDYILEDTFNFKDIDIIVNCAFPMDINYSNCYGGLEYIRKLINKAEKSGVKYFINISSQSIYDPKRLMAACEEDSICPYDLYSFGKYVSEKYLESVCINMKYTNIRLASLIGEGLNARIVNRFVASAIDCQKIKVMAGNQKFSYLDVNDAANGILYLCENLEKMDLYSVYNMGTDKEYSITQIAEYVQKEGELFNLNNIELFVEKTDICSNNTLNCNRLFEQIDWRPEISLADSIKRIYMSMI